MMTIARTASHLLALIVVSAPFMVAATAPTTLVPACEGSGCNWNHLMELARNVVNFLLYGLALPVAAIAFAYAGFQLVVNGASPKARESAKDAFIYAGIGLVVAFGAWVIVRFVMAALFEEQYRSVG